MKGRPEGLRMSKKMVFNNYLNNIFKYSLRWSSSAATASFLFCCSAKCLNLFFEDELQQYTDLQKNLLNGFFTGALFSSARGPIPMMVGSLTGLATVFALHHALIYLRERDYISFEMKF